MYGWVHVCMIQWGTGGGKELRWKRRNRILFKTDCFNGEVKRGRKGKTEKGEKEVQPLF